MDDTHSGGCACGAVRYQARGQPSIGQVCHCRFCQRRLASAFAVLAVFPEDSVQVVQGELAEREYRSDESGRWLRMRFCPDCGTTVFHTSEFRPGFRSIAAGTLDDPTWLKIDLHVWVRSKLPWVSVPDGVAVFQKGPVPGFSGRTDPPA